MQDSGIQEMEEREIVRTRFLLSDRTWAEVGSKQTRIRVWSELEVLARMIITDCIYQVIKETEETEVKTRKVDNSNWLETEEAGVEFDIVPEGWKETDQPQKEKFDMTPDGWKPERLSIKETCQAQEEKVDEIPDGWKQERLNSKKEKNVQSAGRAALEEVNTLKIRFDQKRITKYFRSKDAIEFDKEIRELEKENLQERKRRK